MGRVGERIEEREEARKSIKQERDSKRIKEEEVEGKEEEGRK